MGYTRLPPVSGTGAIVSKPTTSPIPVSDPLTTNYHIVPGTDGIVDLPPEGANPLDVTLADAVTPVTLNDGITHVTVVD